MSFLSVREVGDIRGIHTGGVGARGKVVRYANEISIFSPILRREGYLPAGRIIAAILIPNKLICNWDAATWYSCSWKRSPPAK